MSSAESAVLPSSSYDDGVVGGTVGRVTGFIVQTSISEARHIVRVLLGHSLAPPYHTTARFDDKKGETWFTCPRPNRTSILAPFS
jgi:hypothetical protein